MKWDIICNKKEGQERIISKFLFFPKRIGSQLMWLERVSIKQKLHYMFDNTSGSAWWEWRDLEFIPTEKQHWKIVTKKLDEILNGEVYRTGRRKRIKDE